MAHSQRIAVVTGANRGLGLETSRQLARIGYRVLMGSRNLSAGQAAALEITRQGYSAQALELDVSREDSIKRFVAQVQELGGRVDALVNNAGMVPDADAEGQWQEASVLTVTLDKIRLGMETNVYGHLLLMQAFVPWMLKVGYGRVVNLSSGMGQLAEMNGGYLGYRLSKTAMNVLTRTFADELNGTPVKVNSVCPGWVRTDMGGPRATRSLAQGADTIVWLATLPDDGPSGGFFRDRKPIAW